jgi:hypothetical protein
MRNVNAATACHVAGVHAASCASFAVMGTFVVQVLQRLQQISTFAKLVSTERWIGHFLDVFFFGSVP